MATLPITAYVAGGALATGLVARHQKRYGRRHTFLLGLTGAAIKVGIPETERDEGPSRPTPRE